ncbi:MAG: response regulator transcription factor [Deltaproteobacteria bacterium]|nr:response regulator transcription factor [Deltaproteobacteria bacterium]
MRILVVEDDAPLASVLLRCLREESYAVDHAVDGQEAEWMAFENPYDLIILDLMLPRKDGMDVLQNLRAGDVTAPILILTARDKIDSRVEGLDKGADDFLSKPFELEELTARVRALLRRKANYTPPILSAGALVIDPSRKEVKLAGQVVEFTAKEYSLLEYFARNLGSVLTRTQLSEHVWDVNFEPTSNVVDVYVGYLRTKISKALGFNPIRTIRGHGYMLDMDGDFTELGDRTRQASSSAQSNSHVS